MCERRDGRPTASGLHHSDRRLEPAPAPYIQGDNKENRDAEKPYIRQVAASPDDTTADAPNAAPERPLIYSQFDFVQSGTHTVNQRGGATITKPCEFWKCKNLSGKCKNKNPIKLVAKATGKLFSHLESCNPSEHARIKVMSKGTNMEMDESGQVPSSNCPTHCSLLTCRPRSSPADHQAALLQRDALAPCRVRPYDSHGMGPLS